MNETITKTHLEDNGNETQYETLSDEVLQEIFENTLEPLTPREAFEYIDEKYRSALEDSSIVGDKRNDIEYLILKEKQSAELSYYNSCGNAQEIERIHNKHKQEEREHHQRVLNNTYDQERNEKLLQHQKSLEEERTEKLLKMQLAREKEFITPEEFELLFDLSIETQKQYRSRKNNPIPVFGKRGRGTKVLYRRADVEKWNERR